MYDDPTGRRNASGDRDPTYHSAQMAVRSEAMARMSLCVRVMHAVAESMGITVTNRIHLRDRATGEESR